MGVKMNEEDGDTIDRKRKRSVCAKATLTEQRDIEVVR